MKYTFYMILKPFLCLVLQRSLFFFSLTTQYNHDLYYFQLFVYCATSITFFVSKWNSRFILWYFLFSLLGYKHTPDFIRSAQIRSDAINIWFLLEIHFSLPISEVPLNDKTNPIVRGLTLNYLQRFRYLKSS